MTFPRIQRSAPDGGDEAQLSRPPRTGLAMIVIMSGVLMTAIDTTIVAPSAGSSALATSSPELALR